MSNEKVKGLIKDLFDEIREEVSELIRISPNTAAATESIMEYVSGKITASSKGYITTLYSELSKATLAEPIFESDVNANKFYDLELKKKIYEAYQFDVGDLSAYKAGITSKEINVAYATAASAVGGAAVGGILLGVLSGVVDIPLVVIIAGAVLAGIGGGLAAYKTVPAKNAASYTVGAVSFLGDLEAELLTWVDKIVDYYNQQVEELKKTL